ncbi:MAG: glycosyltransferase family 1 protein [Opitutales bacterium]|nr:glycosyltransferase family 1 protein [Opitutales bacterium]
MKICIITETFPPEVNGVAMTLSRLADGLTSRGHKVQIIRPRQHRKDQTVAVNGRLEVPVRGLPMPGYDGLHFGLPCPIRLRQLWKRDRPDLVHVATEGPLGWNAVEVARRLKLPVVSSYHTNFHSYGKHYGYGKLMQTALKWLRYVHNKTRATFVPSDDVLKMLNEAKFQNLKILGRGVDTQLFSPERRNKALRAQWGVDEETPVALFVGRLANEKNLPLTIEAYERMKVIQPKLKLVLVGDGPVRKELEARHPEIIFAGMRRGEDLAEHYASADLFLFASETETFGNVVTEAMASGLAVLTYNYAAALKYIHNGENGLAVPYKDSNAYLRQAELLITDTALQKRLKEASRASTLDISWEKVTDTYVDDLTALLQ